MRSGFRGHDGSLSIAETGREGLFEVENFFFEAGMGERLCFGEDKATPCVPTRAQSEAKIAGVVKQWTDGF